MPDMAHINGEFVPLAEARVSVNDRAFYYADAVYEVCTTFGGKVFLFDEHLRRLEQSLRGVRIDYSVDRKKLAALFEEGIRRSGYDDVLIYLQISRGVAVRSKDFPSEGRPTLVVTFRQKPSIAPERRARGIEVILVPDQRWAHCDFKTTMLLPNVLAQQQALDSGRDDAVFFDAEKKLVYEATGANVVVAQDGKLVTPNEGPKILSGTVRRYVIDLVRQNGIEIKERPVAVDELLGADEIFLTGTTTEILGVVRVDDHAIGNGVPGPMTKRLYDLFAASVSRTRGSDLL